ncbi:MAG: hypothetical protein D6798_06210 [Deltaproteobacteria bacterium]|nr:MAG: hypothetical protein D6798_06210 [Deltaproteobacteria bacterium]
MAVVLAEVVAVGLDLWLGGYDLVSTEERFNAAAGLQAACGHLDDLRALRYRPFCGGCTAEALLAVPLFRSLGPTVLAWKLIPAGFHLLVAASATWLAGRAAGRRAAIASGGLVLASPAAWRAMSLTGFGNHAEVMGLVLLAGALLVGGLDARRRVAGGLLVLAGGAVAGLATWFCYTAAAGLVATGLTALIARPRRGWWVLPGIAAGLAPLWWEFQAWPGARTTAQVRLAGPSLAPPADLWRWFIGDLFSGSLWPQLEPGLVGGAWWLLLVGLAITGLAGAARRSIAGRWLSFTMFGLAVAMALRHDLWDDNPPLLGFDPFNFRYRVPLLVLLVPAAATVAGRGGRAAAVALSALVLPGLGLRLVGWSGPPADLHRSVVIVADRPDVTVPEGEPPRRLARALGRPQDLQAALAFLRSHADPLPQCRADHVAELGRRAALATLRGHGPEVREVLRAALAEGATIDDLVAGLESARIHDKVDPAELDPILAEVSPDLSAAWRVARNAPDSP